MKIISHSLPSLDEKEIAALAGIIRSNHIATGETVARFEEETADYCGVSGAVACSSGTAALHLALLGLGVGKGMEVILPSFSCASLYHAVTYTGATPVLADCDPMTYHLTVATIMARITFRTKAIILPHMFGLPADMEEILSLGMPVIEDITQAMGATYKGRRIGGFTEVAVTSFYATKMMTTGTGGMVLANDRKLLERMRDLNGVDKRRDLGLHLPYPMNDMQAALGRCQLRKLDAFIEKRRELASRLDRVLRPLPVELPSDLPFRRHVFYRYCIRTTKPVEPVIRFLHRNGIMAERPIFYPLHLLEPKWPIYKRDDFTGTEDAWSKSISLPIYPVLSSRDMEQEASLVQEALNGALCCEVSAHENRRKDRSL